jgi:hypothetical protein
VSESHEVVTDYDETGVLVIIIKGIPKCLLITRTAQSSQSNDKSLAIYQIDPRPQIDKDRKYGL